MPKAPPPGKCVYCRKECTKLTWDHVFPLSWYPESTPPAVQKWRVPSCEPCNNRYSKIEEDLLSRLGLCVERSDIGSLGIIEKVFRSTDPVLGRDPKDQDRRLKKRKKLKREIKRMREIPEVGILPNFGPRTPVHGTSFGMLLISESDLEAFGIKLIRGFTYVLTGSLVCDDYDIGVVFAERDKAQFFVDLVKRFGPTHYRGPGLEVTRAQTADDPQTAGFIIRIWGRLEMYGFVERKELAVP